MNLKGIYYLNEIGEKKNQEDSIWPPPETTTPDDWVFIVCDGVGGSEKGEIASKLVCEFVGNAILKNPEVKLTARYINGLLNNAKRALIEYATKHSLSAGMATTFSMVIFSDDKAFLAWCGDTRIYHIRNGVTKYKTSDHSLVNSLIKSGQISEEEASSHPQKNIILKAISADDIPIEADCHWVHDVREADYFLLCTDGLLENIGDKELKLLLNNNKIINGDIVESFQKYCLNKTKDNYSMYLLEIGDKNKKKSHRITISLLALFLTGLIAASVVLVNKYSENKKRNAAGGMQNGAATDSNRKGQMKDSVLLLRENTDGKKDSLPYVEIVNTPESTDKKSKPASVSIVKPIHDSAKHNAAILFNKKDSSQKSIFISKKNKHAISKRDSVKQTSDSTSN